MKNIILIMFLASIACLLHAQTVAVQQDKSNVLYVGMDNALTILADGYPATSLFVTTDNGTIAGSNGRYISHPDRSEVNMRITIQSKTTQGLKTISVQTMRALTISPQRPTLVGKHGGTISAAEIKTATGPMVVAEVRHQNMALPIVSFSVTIVRNGEIFTERVENGNGAQFSDNNKLVQFLQKLKPGDKLTIEKIKCKCPEGKLELLSDLNFAII